MEDILVHLCAFQQCFCGDTSPVQADASQVFFFNDRCFKAQLCSPDGGYISAGTAAKNDYVVCHIYLFLLNIHNVKMRDEATSQSAYSQIPDPFRSPLLLR